MWYWISNLVFLLLIVGLFFISLWLENWKFKKVLNIRTIALLGLFCALAVVLNNGIGYKIQGRQIAIGNFIFFLGGMILGPIAGFTLALTSDVLGMIIFGLSGVYHDAYIFQKFLFAFAGSLVFIFKNRKIWIPWLFFLMFAILAINLLIISPIGMWTSTYDYGNSSNASKSFWTYYVASLPEKWIIVPELITYSLLCISGFGALYVLMDKKCDFWCIRRLGTNPRTYENNLENDTIQNPIVSKKTINKNKKI